MEQNARPQKRTFVTIRQKMVIISLQRRKAIMKNMTCVGDPRSKSDMSNIGKETVIELWLPRQN